MSLRVMAHVDGGSRGNPGPAGSGVVVSAEDGTALFEGGYFIGRTTNNVAEYRGLLEALRAARRLGATELCVVSDSELLVRQMNGQYKVRNAGLLPLYEEARHLARQFKEVSFRHVRRELNKRADELANKAMDAKRNVEDAAGPMATASLAAASGATASEAKAAAAAKAEPPVKASQAKPPLFDEARTTAAGEQPSVGTILQSLARNLDDASLIAACPGVELEEIRESLRHAARIADE